MLWAFLWAHLAAPAFAAPARKPIEVRVVIVTMWEAVKDGKDLGGELHAWQERWPLKTALPFPAGVHDLEYDPKSHVLAIVTGEATARAAASITALGLDPRFDLRHAYWIVAGTAGVDPKVGSAGSAAWARWVVDGDLAQELDERDAPADWPTGIVPYGRIMPYQAPTPAAHGDEGDIAFRLNPGLVHWAYGKSRSVVLPDDDVLRGLRAPYSGVAARPPFVFEGEGLMGARMWYGPRRNEWAERWVDYWTGGQGVFAMSAEEDTATMMALSHLAHAHRVDLGRVLILRAASDYTVGPPSLTPAALLAKETQDGFPANQEALDDLYRTAAPVARALADDWAHTRDRIPAAGPG